MTGTTSKTILITGSTRGIGLKLAETYVNLGWNVIGTARNLTNADKLRALSPYRIVQLDTADEASILRAAEELEGEAIDLLVNNAGVLAGGGLAETTKEDTEASVTRLINVIDKLTIADTGKFFDYSGTSMPW